MNACLASTYYGSSQISAHVIEVGQTMTIGATTALGGSVRWGPTGPIIPGTCVNGTSIFTYYGSAGGPTCSFYPPASVYPPNSGWPGKWSVIATSFCGFLGRAQRPVLLRPQTTDHRGVRQERRRHYPSGPADQHLRRGGHELRSVHRVLQRHHGPGELFGHGQQQRSSGTGHALHRSAQRKRLRGQPVERHLVGPRLERHERRGVGQLHGDRPARRSREQ